MKPCEALVVPIRERKQRPCGVVAKSQFNGRWLCARHRQIAKQRAAFEAEKAGAALSPEPKEN